MGPRGVMVLDVGFEFCDWGSIPNECQIPRDVKLVYIQNSTHC